MFKRSLVVALATLALTLLPGMPASAATSVTSRISSNTTWTLAGSPYIVNINALYIDPGVTLTIEPGVKVVMNGYLKVIVVRGQLQAIGTPGNSIEFTSAEDYSTPGAGAPGQWRYIKFENAGSGTLNYVTIHYGGQIQSTAPWAYGVLSMASSTDVYLDHVNIVSNENSGVLATGSAPIHISHSFIANNDIGVTTIGTSGGSAIIDNSTLTSNTRQGLFTNHSSTPLVQTSVTYSDITVNGIDGVRLQEYASTPANKHPTGRQNNIFDNGNDPWQLTTLYSRNLPEALWDDNYWGPDVEFFPCPYVNPGFWYGHLVHIFDPHYPQRGPIQSVTYSNPAQSKSKCDADKMPVEYWSPNEIANFAP